MTLAQIVVVVRARWRLALTVLTAVVAAVAAVSLLRAPQYTATASVVLDVKSPDPIAGVVLPGMNAAGYMSTQLGVMQSERVALRALQALGADEDAQLKQAWRDDTAGQGDFRAWLADGLLRKLDIVPVRDSNVVMVTYTSPDPERAAAAANAVVNAYIETTLELRTEPARQYNSFFDARAAQLRDELGRAQMRLSSYQQQKGIVATDERLDIENLRLAELSSQLVTMQGLANESSSRQSQSGANAERMTEVLGNPLLVGLNTELARQEGRLNELTSRLGDNHPQVVELRSNVAQLRERVAADTQRVAGSLTVNDSVNRTRLAQLRAEVEAQRAKLLRLKGQRDESSVLQRDVENAQRAYDMVLARVTQSGVESQATQTNVSVLKRATAPARPSSPRPLLNLVLAVLVGGLLALGAVLVREALDRKLRTDADVMHGLRQPLLGVLTAKALARGAGRASLRLNTHVTGSLTRAPAP